MKYISPSRIHLYEQCPLAYNEKYLEVVGVADDTTEWFASYGLLHHDIYEDIGNKKIPFLAEAIRTYDSRFPTCRVPEQNRSDYYKQGLVAIENKFNELSTLDIIGVEIEFMIQFDFAVPPIHGFIDLVYRDEKGRLIIRDYKTSAVFGKTKMDQQFQPPVYTIAAKHLFGELPFAFEFDFVRFNEIRRIMVNDTYFKLAQIKVKGAWNKMRSGPYPAKYSPFFCNNFCEVRTICPMYLKKNGL